MYKKLVTIFLVVTLVMVQVTWGAEVTETIDTAEAALLEEIIGKVKAVIVVPDEYSEFSYELITDIYDLNWCNEEKDKSIRVKVEENGNILFYETEVRESNDVLVKIGYRQAKQIAQAFLMKVIPQYARLLVLREAGGAPDRSGTYRLTYDLVQEGIPVLGEQIKIDINKRTGEVTQFKGISYKEGRIYSSSVPKLNLEEASAAYLQEIGMHLNYHTYFDQETDKTCSFLCYELDNWEDKAISALTGEAIKPYENYYSQYNGMAYMAAAPNSENSVNTGKELTPSEQKAVDETVELLSIEAIKSKWETHFKALGELEVTNNRLSKRESTYYRSLKLSNHKMREEEKSVDLKIDARTGEIFRYYFYDASDEAKYDQVGGYPSWSQEDAERFIKYVAPDNADKAYFERSYISEFDTDEHNFFFEHRENNIPVEGDNISFEYNTRSGQITRYNKNWNDISYPSPKGKLEIDQAAKHIPFKLVYMKTEPQQYVLVYWHDNTLNFLDAFSGKQIDYYGKEVEQEEAEEKISLYSDIKGHPQEELITRFFNSGIYLNQKELKPDHPITQQEMLTLILRANGYLDNDRTDVYKLARSVDIIDEAEKEPSKEISREEAITYLAKLSSYAKLARRSEVFVYPFKDEVYDPSKKGFIAIANLFGWIEKTEYFRPTEKLTKVEAMTYIYRWLELGDREV